jgi:uncharacterized protein with GYD domain
LNENVCLLQKVIVTIVKKGRAAKVIKAAKKMGAEGATVLMALGEHDVRKSFFCV